MINAILWHLRTGAPWRNLPQRYGPWENAHERLRKWTADGTWERILEHVVVKDDALSHIEWEISVDPTCIQAHSHAAEVRKKRTAAQAEKPWVASAAG